MEHRTPDGFSDNVSAQFTPTTLAAIPYVYITGAARPTDYTILENGGECYDAAMMSPSPDSQYYYYFGQFFTAAQ